MAVKGLRGLMNKKKRKESCNKYRETHLKEYRGYAKKYRLAHPEYGKKYRETHREESREYRKKYRNKHPEQVKKSDKEWELAHPERKKELNRKWCLANPERKRELMLKNHLKRRILGFVPLNKYFKDSEGHHIDEQRVIFMPKEMHQNIRHSVLQNRNMREINKLAFIWLEAEELNSLALKGE